jgi:hypothetical protein
MRFADHPKKLGLLLLPLVPLTAIGIVEVIDVMAPRTVDVTTIETVKVEAPVPPPAPAPVRNHPAPPA